MSVEAIKRFLKHPDCVIFLGSGVSLWSGLPSWIGLLRMLADFLESEGQSSELVRREIANNDLLQAASFGINKMTDDSFGVFIKRAIKFGEAHPHLIHKAIVNLGPTSFITTNYDTLLEQALSTWRPEVFFPAPVTNNRALEIVNILGARASRFIFKPHGDINDISSIVITREQYRALLPGGERHTALDALKTLLLTRPVLYVGFGLRDPDFIYLRDLLINTYQGAVRDHWAIMADVSEEEIAYWRSKYGIRLLGYRTHEGANKSRDHHDLLVLLNKLAAPDEEKDEGPRQDIPKPSEAERTLALTRYTSGLMRRMVRDETPIDVRVSKIGKNYAGQGNFDLFTGRSVRYLLLDGPRFVYLIGPPGSGKSFWLRSIVKDLAKKLQQACLDDAVDSSDSYLPIFVDLKLYQGDLMAVINSELPAGFTLEQFRGNLRIKLVFDAFNEMPTEYIENGSFIESLKKFKAEHEIRDCIVASRTTDSLSEEAGEAVFYELSWFDETHVDAVLTNRKVKLSGIFADDTRRLLSRPFFLHLINKGLVDIPSNPRPRDIYSSFMARLENNIRNRFGKNFPIIDIFSRVAYRAIEFDKEAFPVSWLADIISIETSKYDDVRALDIINWLVSVDILISHAGGRVSFVHQSVTEYCAAIELARRMEQNSGVVREVITSKKWDHCIFLAISLIENDVTELILKDTIKIDISFAINASRYAEENVSYIVSCIFEEIINQCNKAGVSIFNRWPITRLPVSIDHLSHLHDLVSFGNIVAGDAIKLIVRLRGGEAKQYLIDLLRKNIKDYNFSANGIAPQLYNIISIDDFDQIFDIARENFENEFNDSATAIAKVLSRFDSELIWIKFNSSPEGLSEGMAKVLSAVLYEKNDDISFEMLSSLMTVFPKETISNLALALGRTKDVDMQKRIRNINENHVRLIWDSRFSCVLWDNALMDICKNRDDLLSHVKNMANKHEDFDKIALSYCAGEDNNIIMTMLQKSLTMDDSKLRNLHLSFLRLDKFDWLGHEAFLVKTIGRDVPELRSAVLNGMFDVSTLQSNCVGLDIAKPTIQSLADLSDSPWWIDNRAGPLIAHVGNSDVKNFCLSALESGSANLKNWVKKSYLNGPRGITTDEMNEEMIDSLMSDLNIPNKIAMGWYNPLGFLATDRFVKERLLPLYYGSSNVMEKNLDTVLREVGGRYGKRYLVPR